MTVEGKVSVATAVVVDNAVKVTLLGTAGWVNVSAEDKPVLEGDADKDTEATPVTFETVVLAGILNPETVSPAMTPVAAPMLMVCVAPETSVEVARVVEGCVKISTSLAATGAVSTPLSVTHTTVLLFVVPICVKVKPFAVAKGVVASVTISPNPIPLNDVSESTKTPLAAAYSA